MDIDCQEDINSLFADMDRCLVVDRPAAPVHDHRRCYHCNSRALFMGGSAGGFPGAMVCNDCGVVQSTLVLYEYLHWQPTGSRVSNYKRIHHFHERCSQLLLQESEIPPDKMLLIGEQLCDGTHPVINKDVVRSVLRSLNLQLYIEKYLQIIQRVTGISPPVPGPQLLMALDSLFVDLQQPFEACKPSGRKNYLNYNYVFNRLFQKLGCTQFCMFFPLIKSKAKLRALDDTYELMCGTLNWEFKPLQQVAPFSVRLESPEIALQRIRAECDRRSQVGLGKAQWRTEFRKSDLRLVSDLQQSQSRSRSTHLAQEFQRSVSGRKRPLSEVA